MRIVPIKTEDFQADAYFIGDLPLKYGLELALAEGPKQFAVICDVIKIALVDQAKVPEFEALSFNEALDVASAYLQWNPRTQIKEH